MAETDAELISKLKDEVNTLKLAVSQLAHADILALQAALNVSAGKDEEFDRSLERMRARHSEIFSLLESDQDDG